MRCAWVQGGGVLRGVCCLAGMVAADYVGGGLAGVVVLLLPLAGTGVAASLFVERVGGV